MKKPPDDVERIITETVDRHMDHVDPTLGFYYRATLGDVVEWEANGAFVHDMRGDEWLDALSFMGVFGVGHRHPKVVEAARAQLERMPMNARYFFNKPQAELATRLAQLAPGGKIKNVFFSNSGSEAVDVALKCARFTTGRSEIISTEHSYHGMTIGAASISGMRHFRDGIEPLLPGVRFVPFGDIEALRATISRETACVIMEPVHSGLGSQVAPDGYLRQVSELCAESGALFIADEVQTALGRTGKLWGVDLYGDDIAPDIICMGKLLSGGVIPMAATLYSAEVTAALSKRLVFNTSTFGGSELGCAVALATVNLVVEEDLPARAAEAGEILGGQLAGLAERYPQHIRDVRGVGLMWTVEFSDPMVSFYLFPHMLRERRVLVAPNLSRADTMRISPPLNIDHALLGRISDAIESGLQSYEQLDPVKREAFAYAYRSAIKETMGEEMQRSAGVEASR